MKLKNNLNSVHKVCEISSNQNVVTDLITSLCGKRIGNGVYREVFEYNLDNKYVIKIEENADCNIAEQILWYEVSYLTGNLAWVKEWFAPILWVSPNGNILVMRKTEPKPSKKRPENVPAFFADVHYDNFGWIGNKFVCHDYGFIYNFIQYGKKMKKIKW